MKERRRVYGSDSGLGDALTLRIINYNVRVYSGENDITDKLALRGTPWHIGTDLNGDIYLAEKNDSNRELNMYSASDGSFIRQIHSTSGSYIGKIPSLFSTTYGVFMRSGNKTAVSFNPDSLSINSSVSLGSSGSIYIYQLYKNRYLVTSETYEWNSDYYILTIIDSYDLAKSTYTLNISGEAWPYFKILPMVGNSDYIVAARYLESSSSVFYLDVYNGNFNDHVVSGNLTHLPTREHYVNINYVFDKSYYGCTPMSAYTDDTGIYLYVQCYTEGDYGYNYYYEYLYIKHEGGVTRMTPSNSVKIDGMIASDGKNTYIFEPSYGSSSTSRSYISNDPSGSNMNFTQMTDYSLLGIQMPLPKS